MQAYYCFLGILRYALPHFIVKLLNFTYRLSHKGPKHPWQPLCLLMTKSPNHFLREKRNVTRTFLREVAGGKFSSWVHGHRCPWKSQLGVLRQEHCDKPHSHPHQLTSIPGSENWNSYSTVFIDFHSIENSTHFHHCKSTRVHHP